MTTNQEACAVRFVTVVTSSFREWKMRLGRKEPAPISGGKSAKSEIEEATSVLLGSLGTPGQDDQEGGEEAEREGEGVQETAKPEAPRQKTLTEKMCRGPLHPPGGEMLPISEFHFYRKGRRAGKPLSRCKRCEKIRRGRDPERSGTVPMIDVLPMLRELDQRLGRLETCRRARLNKNGFWYHVDHLHYPGMQFRTYFRIKALYDHVLATNERREPNDIAWGRKARGHAEGLVRARALLAKIEDREYQVDIGRWEVRNEPDKTWWIQDGNQWLPRYGSEMLGNEF